MNTIKMKPIVMQAFGFLKKYAEENNVALYDLFDKETLIEHVSLCDWDWSVNDELEQGNTGKETQVGLAYGTWLRQGITV